jgi:hypothetical protein
MNRKIIYRLDVSVTMPLADDDDSVDFYTLAQATDAKFKRSIEVAAFNCLKRMEQECDVELMDFTVEEDS